MDLQLSRKGDYAVRAAIDLAMHYSNGFRKIREIAADMDLPLRYTPQILGVLTSAGLAQAKAGREGGYRLRRPPSEISLLDVVEAAEGTLKSSRCTLRGGPCALDGTCPVHDSWVRAREALRSSLAGTTLAYIVAHGAVSATA
jgi:Rrf2 family protein